MTGHGDPVSAWLAEFCRANRPAAQAMAEAFLAAAQAEALQALPLTGEPGVFARAHALAVYEIAQKCLQNLTPGNGVVE